MSMQLIELTQEQQQALELGCRPHRVVDLRSRTAYVLVPEGEYDEMRELLDDEMRGQAIRAAALRNAAGRLEKDV